MSAEDELVRERQARKGLEELLSRKSKELEEAQAKLKHVHETSARSSGQMNAARLEALIASLPFAIVVEDEERRISLTNQSFCALFGLPQSPSELVGADCNLLAQRAKDAFQDPAAFEKRLEEILRNRRAVLEERCLLADGRLLLRDYVPVFVEGIYRGHLWRYEDITTEAKQREALEKARHEADAANQTKSQFLAMMSHEMRTPLSAIVGLSEILATSPLPPDLKQYATRTQQNANSLLRLIQDILDFSKLEAGQVRLELAPFSPEALAYEVGEVFFERAQSKGIELVVQVDGAVPTWVIGDELRLRQILVNLVGNAIQFTKSGSINLRVESTPSHDLWYSVEDTGEPIPPAERERIFERFVRLQGAKIPGTGLGLSISRGLAELMGGRLWVESAEGGNVFRLVVHHELPNMSIVPAAIGSELHGVRVLVVSPNDAQRRALDTILGNVGASVQHIREVAEWRKVGSRGVDVLVFDDRVAPEGLTSALPGTPLIAICSGGRPRPEVLALGIPAVAAPIRPAALIAAIGQQTKRFDSASVELTADLVPLTSVPAHLLVAEDDPDNRMIIERALQRAGHRVDFSEDGLSAFERSKACRYDLLITDVAMPHLSGIDLAKAIRSLEVAMGRPRLPIVGLSAHAFSSAEQECLEAGMDAYLTKPFTRRSLFEIVERHRSSSWRILLCGPSAGQMRASSKLEVESCTDPSSLENRLDRFRPHLVVLADPRVTLEDWSKLVGRWDSRLPVASVLDKRNPTRIATLNEVESLALHVLEGKAPEPLIVTRDMVEVDPDLLDLVPGYLASRKKDADRLQVLVESKDWRGIQRIGHNIRGTGAAYGFDVIGRLGGEIEEAAKAEHGPRIEAAARELATYVTTIEIRAAGK